MNLDFVRLLNCCRPLTPHKFNSTHNGNITGSISVRFATSGGDIDFLFYFFNQDIDLTINMFDENQRYMSCATFYDEQSVASMINNWKEMKRQKHFAECKQYISTLLKQIYNIDVSLLDI